MRYPTLNEINSRREMVDVFGGYNHNLRIGDGEFYDMKNLTSTYYPVLSPRQKRGSLKKNNDAELPKAKYALIEKDGLGYIGEVNQGIEFFLNGYHTNGLGLGLTGKIDLRKTTVTSMGSYVVIITRDSENNILDKKWVNTSVDEQKGTLECGNIEASAETPLEDEKYVDDEGNEHDKYVATFQMCSLEKDDDYVNVPEEYADDHELVNGDLLLDKSEKPYSLKKWSESQNQWVTVPTTYIKITLNGASNCFADFNVFDGVYISGIESEELADINKTTSIIWDKGDNWIKVVGVFSGFAEQFTTKLTIERKMPDIDFVTESNNRLWGCRYGLADDGKGGTVWVNEIYACKQGDFKNWNCFMGLSTDSYAVSLGSDGPFTGAITHLGYPIFFKENHMHKVYGNYPANYQLQNTVCRGVQSGSSKSLAIVNETLLYKSKNGICAYDGSLPTEISSVLGDESYSDAVACSHRNKYYVSMKGADGKFVLFVYDVSKGLWHKEDNTQVDAFCSCKGELFYIGITDGIVAEDEAKEQILYNTQIKTMFGSGTKEDDPVKWMAETGIIGVTSPDKKYISRLNVKMSLAIGSRVHFYIQYNSNGEWEHISTMTGISLKTFSMPIRPKRCDHLRLKIEGEGEAKVYSIIKTIEEGSDV